ncbi:MAG: hypothetical protein ACRC1M_07435 [Methanobacteriaceae archaeon]
MNKKSLNILKEAISTAGKWTYWETSNDSITLEFEDVQLYDPFLDELDTFSSIISLRFSSNAFLTCFDNECNSSPKNNHSSTNNFGVNDFIISDKYFNLNSFIFEFQNFDSISKIKNSFINEAIMGNIRTHANNNGSINNNDININNNYHNTKFSNVDYILTFYNSNIGIICGGNNLECIDNNGILNDDDIKNRSNRWMIYCIDYWKNKDKNKYNTDNSCESLNILKK